MKNILSFGMIKNSYWIIAIKNSQYVNIRRLTNRTAGAIMI